MLSMSRYYFQPKDGTFINELRLTVFTCSKKYKCVYLYEFLENEAGQSNIIQNLHRPKAYVEGAGKYVFASVC